MMKQKFILPIAGFVFWLPLAAWSQSPREVIQRGKAATALVEIEGGKGATSATCIDGRGIFVTNKHVVEKLAPGAKLRLVLNANEPTKRELLASVLRIDDKADLAVLKAEDATDLASLPLGDDSELYETMSVTAFGFPFGKALAVTSGGYPDMSVNVGRITSLRKNDGTLQQVQLDAQVNPGNSGGPVVDEKGHVIGIVQSGVFATGVNFAVPVSMVKSLIQRPEITMKAPLLDEQSLHSEAEFRVRVLPLFGDLGPIEVELELQPGATDSRRLTAVREADDYIVRAIPFPPAAGKEPARLSGKLTFAKGSIQGEIADQAFKVGSAEVTLAEIGALDPSAGKATRHEGGNIEGPISGLEKVSIDLGGFALDVDLSRAAQLVLDPPKKASPGLNYAVVVRRGGKILHRLEGRIGSRVAAEPEPGAIAFTPFRGDKLTLELPDTVADVIMGRGGRMVLLYLKKARQIAVYDANEAKIIKYLPVSSDDVLLAASLEKLIVYAPAQNVIEVWSLTSFSREKAQIFPIKGVVKCMALGYASSGPLLVHHADGTEQLSRASYTLLNLDTLEPIEMTPPLRAHNSSFRDAVHIRASGTGDVFGLWATSHSPQGLETIILHGRTAKNSYDHDSAGHVVPNFDGSAVLTGLRGVSTAELTNKTRGGRAMPAIPTTHPRFYLSIPYDPGAAVNLGLTPFAGRKAYVALIDSDQPLADLPAIDLGKSEPMSWSRSDFTLDKRVCFIVQADQLISIPFTNDRLIVQRFNLKETLDKAGLDYFYVSSMPSRTFSKGQLYQYAATAECNKPGVEFELLSGPPGMAISKSGELSWQVPADFEQDEVNVLITARHPSGKSMHQTFKLQARKSG